MVVRLLFVQLITKKQKSGIKTVWADGGTFDTKKCPIEWAKELEKRGQEKFVLLLLIKRELGQGLI